MALSGRAAHRFFRGIGFLARGLRLWGTSPKVMLLGAIPALIVGAVYLALFIVFVSNLPGITSWVTPFASVWDEPLRTTTRTVAGIALTSITVLAMVLTFAAITLAVGDPFYERIWRSVEQREGNPPPNTGETFWGSVRRGTGNGIRMLLATALVSVALFVGGFIPVVGQTVVPVIGWLTGGWFLTVGLAGFAFDARRFSLRERRRMLGSNRAGALGFGTATYLLFLIPGAAVVVMPAAVAGATLLSRSVIGETRQRSVRRDSDPVTEIEGGAGST